MIPKNLHIIKILFHSGHCVYTSLLRQLWKSTSCATRKGFPCVMDTVKELGFEDFFSYFSPTTYCLYFCSTVASKILTKWFGKVKFMFSKKVTKIYEIFTVNLTLCSQCQFDGEHFVNFCGLLRKYELYHLPLVAGPVELRASRGPLNPPIFSLNKLLNGPLPQLFFCLPLSQFWVEYICTKYPCM